MPRKRFVIVRDEESGRLLYYIRTGLGIFWECSHNPDEARVFETRGHASKVLTTAGKHRQGWRVLAAQ